MVRRVSVIGSTVLGLVLAAGPAFASGPEELVWCLLHWSEC